LRIFLLYYLACRQLESMNTERGKLPDLVADTRLVAEVHATRTNYFNTRIDSTASPYVRRTRTKETWTRTKRLGGGATGEVWLEECHAAIEEGGQARQPVKVVSKGIEFSVYEELETIAKFSQTKVRWSCLLLNESALIFLGY
jgi:hypothetical protein